MGVGSFLQFKSSNAITNCICIYKEANGALNEEIFGLVTYNFLVKFNPFTCMLISLSFDVRLKQSWTCFNDIGLA